MATRKSAAAKKAAPTESSGTSAGAMRCRRKFLKFFPEGFQDDKYISWERGYKWEAHEAWEKTLGRDELRRLLKAKEFAEVAARAVRIESRTNLLFSFEKMALRDAVKSTEGARAFAEGLYEFLHGAGDLARKFERWCGVVEGLPRRQTRVLTWPLVTVFGFIAQPRTHFFLKPNVTRAAAREYEYDFEYKSRPSWEIYSGLLKFAGDVCRDLRDLHPRDMMDIQSFLWVQGSDEYDE
ncbi:MAG: hypothetical protein WCD76_12210 [Pyrinomonadaceae bacterium]